MFDIFEFLGIEVTSSQKTVQKAINSLDLKKKAALNNNAKYSKIRDWIFNERLNQEFLKYVNAIRLLRGANNNQNQMEDNLFDIFDFLGIEVTSSQKTVQKAINSLDLKKNAALNNNAKYSKIRDWIFNERLNQEFLNYVNNIRAQRGTNNNQTNTNQTHSDEPEEWIIFDDSDEPEEGVPFYIPVEPEPSKPPKPKPKPPKPPKPEPPKPPQPPKWQEILSNFIDKLQPFWALIKKVFSNNASPTLSFLLRPLIALNSTPFAYVVLSIIAISLAWLNPDIGTAKWQNISLSQIAHWSIPVLFFLYGLMCNFSDMDFRLSNFKFHILTQAGSMLIYPFFSVGIIVFTGLGFQDDESISLLCLGIFFLYALPSDLPLSHLLGYIVTPYWISLIVSASPDLGVKLDVDSIYTLLLYQMVVPIIGGAILRYLCNKFFQRHSRSLLFIFLLYQSIVILIIYTSFCNSFKHEMFTTIKISTILAIFVGMLVLYVVVNTILFCIYKTMLNEEDTGLALFNASNKSLVDGTVLSQILFVVPYMTGLLLLPLLLYHTLYITYDYIKNIESYR
ncbi:MAG: bile acid:sodium symporter [Thermoguttaceae bacterium]|nr:bile acid:sodium symporter [Thermoguttaceae bacterium]